MLQALGPRSGMLHHLSSKQHIKLTLQCAIVESRGHEKAGK